MRSHRLALPGWQNAQEGPLPGEWMGMGENQSPVGGAPAAAPRPPAAGPGQPHALPHDLSDGGGSNADAFDDDEELLAMQRDSAWARTLLLHVKRHICRA